MADLDPSARVNPEQVMDLIDTALTEAQCNAMINTAHLVVEQHLADKSLDEDLLTQIELWLSAHYVCMRDPRKKQVKVDEVSITYQVDGGLGLNATSYGQQAIALDPSNTLASRGLKRAIIQAE